MNRTSGTLIFALVGLLALSAGPPQEGSQDLQATLRELRTLRADSYRLKRERQRKIDGARDATATLRADLKLAEEDLRKTESKLAVIQKDTEDLEAPLSRAAGSRRDTSAAVNAFLEAVRKHVSSGIPYRVDSRMKQAEGSSGTIGPLAQTAGLARTLFQDELRIARSGEAYSDEVKLPNGHRKHARVLRIGLHLLAFVTEDGLDVGIHIKGEGWVTDQTRFDPDAVRSAIEVLDRTRAPEWVTLPVDLTAKAETKK